MSEEGAGPDLRIAGRETGSADLDAAALLRREREAIWRRQWLLVGHVSEFAQVGAFRTVDVAGEGVAVVNGGDGLRALSNTCLHRGYPFCTQEAGVVERFTCPVHGWTYDLTGRLVHPELAGTRRRVRSLPLEVWNGWVFACLAPRGASVSLSDRWGAALAATVEPVSLLRTVMLASDRRWSELIGVPWAARWPHPVEQDGVFTLADGDEHVFVIEPALSALRFRAGLVTTYTLRPTGPRTSRSVISWYVRPADTGTAAEDLHVLMRRDHHELVAHLAGSGSSVSAARARERYAGMLDGV